MSLGTTEDFSKFHPLFKESNDTSNCVAPIATPVVPVPTTLNDSLVTPMYMNPQP